VNPLKELPPVKTGTSQRLQRVLEFREFHLGDVVAALGQHD